MWSTIDIVTEIKLKLNNKLKNGQGLKLRKKKHDLNSELRG